MGVRILTLLVLISGAGSAWGQAQVPVSPDASFPSPPKGNPADHPQKEVSKEPAPQPPTTEVGEAKAGQDGTSTVVWIGIATACGIAVAASALTVKVLSARSPKHFLLDDPWVREKIRRDALLVNQPEPNSIRPRGY